MLQLGKIGCRLKGYHQGTHSETEMESEWEMESGWALA